MTGGSLGQPLPFEFRLVQAARNLIHVVADPIQRRADCTDQNASRPLPYDLTALLLGQSACAAQVKHTDAIPIR